MRKYIPSVMMVLLSSSALAGGWVYPGSGKQLETITNIHTVKYSDGTREVYATGGGSSGQYGVWCDAGSVSGVYLTTGTTLARGETQDIKVDVERQSVYKTDTVTVRFVSDGKGTLYASTITKGDLVARYLFDARLITFDATMRFNMGGFYGAITQANCK